MSGFNLSERRTVKMNRIFVQAQIVTIFLCVAGPLFAFTQSGFIYTPIQPSLPYYGSASAKAFADGIIDFFAKPETTTRDIYIPSPNAQSIEDIFTNTVASVAMQWVIVKVDEPTLTVSFIPQFDTSLFESFDNKRTNYLYLSTITVTPTTNATYISIKMISKPRLTYTVDEFSTKLKAKIPQIWRSVN